MNPYWAAAAILGAAVLGYAVGFFQGVKSGWVWRDQTDDPKR
jgi:hypothetical protein